MKTKENFTYETQQSEYVIKMKKRNYWWLLLFLLLLLPLLLLITMKKDVHFKTVDAINQTTLANTNVQFTYVDKQLYNFKTSSFLTHDTLHLKGVTGDDGIVIFEAVKYTVYSKLFHGGELTTVTATNDCFMGDSIRPKFHKLKNKREEILELPYRTYDYQFQVIDIDDGQPIVDADVTAESGNGKKWNVKTDPSGMVVLEDFPYCGDASVYATAYGYDRDSIIKSDARYFYGNIDSARTLRLMPIKKMIKFLVKDLVTKQPIANATAELIIDGTVVQTVKTNINGRGTAVGEGSFDEVKITETVTIHAEKAFYNDTSKTAKVDDFIKLDEEGRTLYLRPTLSDVQFRDTDGRNGLSGVKNIITINGKKRPTPEFSNGSGYFMVSGVRATDKISITASKSGYRTNSSTIRSRKFSDLMSGNASKRDIPLTKNNPPPPPPPPPPPNDDPPPPNVVPCDAPVESGGEGVTIKVHSVGSAKKFAITWDMYSVPDRLIVYCGTGSKKKVIYDTRTPVSKGGTANLRCSKNYITVKVIGSDNTQWKYKMQCD